MLRFSFEIGILIRIRIQEKIHKEISFNVKRKLRMSNVILVGALGPLSSAMETDSGQPTFVDDTKKCSLGEHCNIKKHYFRINEDQSRSSGLPVGSIVCVAPVT